MNFEEIALNVNQENSSFELVVDGQRAFIDFVQKGNTFHLIHTEVPQELEGKGVAAVMVAKTLQYLDTHNFKMVPSCSYVQYYIKRHPEWKKLSI
jgi:uncharacterized protein